MGDDAVSQGMSKRGWVNVASIMPKIKDTVAEKEAESRGNSKNNSSNSENKPTSPPLDLAISENWLVRKETIDICNEVLQKNLEPRHLSYPSGLAGDPDLIEALAEFYNRFFNPLIPVLSDHIVVGPGAAGCIDALLVNICDPGDAVLIPAPYWNRFDFLLEKQSSVKAIPVPVENIEETLTEALIPALEDAITKATLPVKAMMFTNPHNPLAQCYPRSVIEKCIQFCHKHSIHLISDEIYALTKVRIPGSENPQPFISALSLDIPSLGCDPGLVHVVWSTSKDLGQTGFRMGSLVTQKNQNLKIGAALSLTPQLSSLTAVAVTGLLRSPKLDALLKLNEERLCYSYGRITNLLDRYHIRYFPAHAGLYIFARLAGNVVAWEREEAMIQRFKENGVVVGAGHSYHPSESTKGWARITFALEPSRLDEAIRRMDIVLSSMQADNSEPRTLPT